MQTNFVCLANSFKEGGRCLAGIELDANNNPVFVNDRPKWIRPVCNTFHGEVPNRMAESFHVLDILELKITAYTPENHQSENVLFENNSIHKIGAFNHNQLANLVDIQRMIFGNRGRAVSKEYIGKMDYSLMLVNVINFEVTQKVYEDDFSDKSQIRMVFSYNGIRYDFPVTDPVFLHHYQRNPDLLEEVNQAYLCLSLGIVWMDWYYKLVAGIIF
jgi:uncharacterized protein YprB with RNaseH-like and TPR domain